MVGYAVIEIECEQTNTFYMTLLECKTATLEEAAEKGLTKEQLQAIIDEIVEKNS